jgi:alanine racemase
LLNGEGALRYPGWGGGMARVGLALYGYSAQPEHAAHLEPALSWKTHVIAIKDLPAGHGVGYGPLFRAPRPMRIATIAVGYADGYHRLFYPGARVLIGGVVAPVVGAISMDLTTVDVSGLPTVRLGDEVTLLGRGNGQAITAVELAALAKTIPYEILCGLSARVQRLYRD